jgi:hypothetical protein
MILRVKASFELKKKKKKKLKPHGLYESFGLKTTQPMHHAKMT